jgi:hypothetical protein
VQLLACLRAHRLWSFLEDRGTNGASLEGLARRFGANRAYLNVVLRHLALHGWIDWQPQSPLAQTRVHLTALGAELGALLDESDAAEQIVRFGPVARNMGRYLFGSYRTPRGTPELATLVGRNRDAWGLGRAASPRGPVTERLRLGLEGNLLGPVAVALKSEFYPGPLGAWLERSPRAWQTSWVAEWAQRHQRARLFDAFAGAAPRLELRALRGQERRLRAAFELLSDAGWVELDGSSVTLTDKGRYAAPRAWAYGVPVSYLPLFGRLDELLFGDHQRLLHQVPGKPEAHVDRRMNVKASGASHGRYFAAADRVVLEAFDRPFAEQPRGFADMGSGDGAWLQHIWELVRERTLRGQLMREFPERSEYRLLMVGIDYNRAARRATRERLTRAGVPHLVTFGDVNDPEGLRTRLAKHGVDSRDLLHGSSFLIHNRPYRAPRAPGASERPKVTRSGAYVAGGIAIEGSALRQNLAEFFRAWREIIGQHGLLVIELHDPERVVIGKTLTNYMLTHGLSDQLTVELRTFLAAAREGGLEASAELQQLFPAQREFATVSVNHFRRAP